MRCLVKLRKLKLENARVKKIWAQQKEIYEAYNKHDVKVISELRKQLQLK